MGLILGISWHPTPRLNGADDSLATFVDMDVLTAPHVIERSSFLNEPNKRARLGISGN